MASEETQKEIVDALAFLAGKVRVDNIAAISIAIVHDDHTTSSMRAGDCCGHVADLNLSLDLCKAENINDHHATACEDGSEAVEPDPATKH